MSRGCRHGPGDDGDQIGREQVANTGGVVGVERGRPVLEAGGDGCAVRVRVGPRGDCRRKEARYCK